MKLWRPKNRFEWWSALIGALLVLAPAISFGGLAIVESLQISRPAWFLFGPIAATIPAIYLALVTRLPLFWKVLLAALLAASIAVIYQPRSSCGRDDNPVNPTRTSHAKIEDCNG